MRKIKTFVAVCALLLAGSAFAQTVKVEGAWARATVQGQKATGAFMVLTAPEGARLVGASTPAANVAEVHEMTMEGDVMKMRALAGGLELPAGKPVELKPGSYHIMLIDLKAPLAAGSAVPLTLVLRDAKGAEVRQELQVPVRAVTAPPAGGQHMPMSK